MERDYRKQVRRARSKEQGEKGPERRGQREERRSEEKRKDQRCRD